MVFSEILLRTRIPAHGPEVVAGPWLGEAWVWAGGSPEVAEVLTGQAATHLLEGLQPGSWLLQAVDGAETW